LFSKVVKVDEINIGSPYQIDRQQRIIKNQTDELTNNEVNNKDNKKEAEEIIENAKKEAEKIIKEAEKEKLNIINNAKKEIEELKKREIDKAKKSGYDDGNKKGYNEHQKKIKAAENKKIEAENLFNESVKGLEKDIIDLVINISENLLNYDMQKSKDYIKFRIKKAMEKTNDRDSLVIRVSKFDFEYLNENKDNLIKMIGDVKNLEVLKDDNLNAGDCIVESQYGSINNNLRKQFDLIKTSFNNLLNQKDNINE
jgi:flagellar assembly protein FliH